MPFVDVCRFTATSSGTGDFVVSAAVTGYQTPASAGAVNAKVYSYRAESADLTQWEIGQGAYTSASTTLARTTVLFNSSGTTAKINFSAAPQVAIVALAEDLKASQWLGTETNDSASAGNLGEILSSEVLSGSAVSLTNNTPAQVTSLSITAGDWDVWGVVSFTGGATTTVNYLLGAIHTTTATATLGLGAQFFNSLFYASSPAVFGTLGSTQPPTAPIVGGRVSLSGTTTYYLNAQAGFGTSTCSAFGAIIARRRR